MSTPGDRLLVVVAVRLLTGLVLLAGLQVWPCRGEDEAPSPAGPKRTPPASVVVAATTPRDNRRDPFWPVDFIRPAQPGERLDPDAAAKIGEQEWRTVEKSLRETVRGVSRLPARSGRDEFLVLINGNVYGVGDVVSLAANGKTYRWKIASIALRDGPVFERMPSARSAPPPKKYNVEVGSCTRGCWRNCSAGERGSIWKRKHAAIRRACDGCRW